MKDRSTVELLQQQTALHGSMKEIKQQKRAVDAELQRRAIAESAARKLAQMSPSERAVAAQLIGQAGGIQSDAAVGTPGAQS